MSRLGDLGKQFAVAYFVLPGGFIERLVLIKAITISATDDRHVTAADVTCMNLELFRNCVVIQKKKIPA